MGALSALRAAAGDLFGPAWRLVVPNLVAAAVFVLCFAAVTASWLGLVLLVLLVPPLGALVHGAVLQVSGRPPGWADLLHGARRGGPRGGLLLLALLVVVTVGLEAVVFYTRRLPVLAFVAADLLLVMVVALCAAWVVAVRHAEAGPAEVVVRTAELTAAHGWALVRLTLLLLVVDAVGTVSVVPALLATGALTWLALAHLLLSEPPPEPEREPSGRQRVGGSSRS